MNIFQSFIHLIYPNKCIFCDQELPISNQKGTCQKCYYKLPIKDENRCLICSRQIYEGGYRICPICQKYKIQFDVAYSPFLYEGIMKETIRKFKFVGKMWYANILAMFLYEELKGKKINADYIVYPPTNKKTFEKRGYNQAQLLAFKLSKRMNIPCLNHPIIKLKENEKQSLTHFKNRFNNVRGVFGVNKKYIEILKDKNVLFIDDVLTTGATASECAKILKKCGVKMVTVATICITK